VGYTKMKLMGHEDTLNQTRPNKAAVCRGRPLGAAGVSRCLPFAKAQALALALLDFEGMADLKAWLATNA
jgi:hypothetical protein